MGDGRPFGETLPIFVCGYTAMGTALGELVKYLTMIMKHVILFSLIVFFPFSKFFTILLGVFT
jgi:hypothetical protein